MQSRTTPLDTTSADTTPSGITVDLLRHGRTEKDNIFRGVTDVALCEEGWEQMTTAIADDKWDAVVSSPLIRCSLFAKKVAGQQNCTLEIADSLMEFNFGDWDGKTFDEVLQTHEQEVTQFFNHPGTITPPNGEVFEEFKTRVIHFWSTLIQDAESKATSSNVLVVSHGGVINAILSHVLGVPHLHGKLSMPYASRSRVYVPRGGGTGQLLFHR